MTQVRVVDTNVAVAANARNTHADLECQLACLQALNRLVKNGKVVLDNTGLIISEYRKHLKPAGQPGVGDKFYKHLLNNQHNRKRCLLVDIRLLDASAGEFAEFPDDSALTGFDPDDRKFVAAALAIDDPPPIINPLDTDWRDFEAALAMHGVILEQLCPQHMRKET